MVHIVEVKGKKGLKKFIDFSWEIYKNDPNWVPPLRSDLLKTLQGRDNPLFMNGPHAFFMAYRDGRPAGRICAGINETLNRKKGKEEGYICLFECINDGDVAACLFDHAADWLKKRGKKVMKGPVSPTNGDDYRGLLVKGFDGPPVLMNSYNPDYYPGLFEAHGFQKHLDLYAYYYDVSGIRLERYSKVIQYAMKRYNFRVEPVNLKKLDREVKDIKRVLDEAMPADWEDLTPPSLEEIKAQANKLKDLADPDLIYIARSGDRPIGFALGLPDYNQVLKRLNGRLFPLGFLKFMWFKRKITGARIFVLFVVPEFRKKAVSSTIYYKCLQAAKRKGYTYGEGSTIGEINLDMRRDAEGAGGIHYRTYRIYRKDI